ncbi:MAG: FAD-dependent oxidoreductase [Bacteroidetes bacterium 47-18]|nr:MAG: FAD-dependent oxidoreductase [Bacteroidetes bacterium 47-18]
MQEKIIIVGAGFAGLHLAKQLQNTHNEVMLIDKHNYHQFQPLFYQVATARIEPSSISFPLRKVFQRSRNISIRIAEVQHIDSAQQTLHTNIGPFNYTRLIIATGCTTNFFGNKAIEAYAFPMKSTPEALTLRNRILSNFEKALSAAPEEMEGIMNIVVVGGGPTGVELAGSLAEMKTKILPKDYPDMDFSRLNIFLLEGSNTLLGPMSEVSRRKAKEYLEALGVKVCLQTLVEAYDGHTISLKGNGTIVSDNLIWAAGVSGNLIKGLEKATIQRGNRIVVDRYNKVVGYDNIFAVGDIAFMETPLYPNGHPQVANVAINQGKLLAQNIKKYPDRPNSWKMFEYKDPGSMATVGKRKAVVDLPSFSFQGRMAWFTWMFLHLMLILSVRNKLFIFINWAISYFTNDTTLRLILHPSRRQVELLDNQPE